MKKSILASLLVLFFFSIFLCAEDDKETLPKNNKEKFLLYNEPVPLEVKGNPLQYAGQRIGLDFDKFELPNQLASMYRFAARFPQIDYVSQRPLYMKQWTEDTADLINNSHKEKKLNAIIEILKNFKGSDKFLDDQEVKPAPEIEQFKDSLKNKSPYTENYQKILIELYTEFKKAEHHTKLGQKNLTKEDLDFFYSNPSYYLLTDGKNMPTVTSQSVGKQFVFIDRARRIAFEHIFTASKILAQAISKYVDQTKNFKTEDFIADKNQLNFTAKIQINNKVIIIGGFGPDEFNENSSFIIDLGGNDTYKNNAGGFFNKQHLNFVIDHSGDDKYDAPDKDYVQGFGFLGTGYLVDLKGDDVYKARHFSQGAGVLGIGAIWDNQGDDQYDAHGFVQGAGMFGMGVLLETNGDDKYDASVIAQASSTTLGYGILSDLDGDDKYVVSKDKTKNYFGINKSRWAVVGYGQGSGVGFRGSSWSQEMTAYGGVGLLVENNGDDKYEAGGWCNQGGSYLMCHGALVDYNGNDTYRGGCSMGSSIHVTNAILIDKNGDDNYGGGFRNGGSGSDRSPGFLIDYHGNDTYGAADQSYEMAFGVGCKVDGFSLLIDYEGNDKYLRKEPQKIGRSGYPRDVFGGIWPGDSHVNQVYGIALDLGGNDEYGLARRKNNTQRVSYGQGIHIDMEWNGGDVFGKMTNPLPAYENIKLPENVLKSKYADQIKLLTNPDCFIRYQAVGSLTTAGIDVVPYLVDSIINSDNLQFNRDVMECLHYYIVGKKFPQNQIPELVKLLNAKSEEVRATMAFNFGLYKIPAENALVKTVQEDKSGRVRMYALAGLYYLDSKKGLEICPDVLEKDPYFRTRRIAVLFLAKNKQQSTDVLIKAFKNDKHYGVKATIAEMFATYYDEKVIDLMREASKSYDVFLKRSAAKALVNHYQLDGIKVLIEELDYPSIDDYGRSLAEFLVKYTGKDFDKYGRKLRTNWEKWFAENKDKIDLKKTLRANEEFSTMMSKMRQPINDFALRRFDMFLNKYPDHYAAKKTYAEILNGKAWDMVTADKKSRDFQPKKGLEYAIKAAELNPSSQIIDTLAEAYYANGDMNKAIKICQEFLKTHPKDETILNRLESWTNKDK